MEHNADNIDIISDLDFLIPIFIAFEKLNLVNLDNQKLYIYIVWLFLPYYLMIHYL